MKYLILLTLISCTTARPAKQCPKKNEYTLLSKRIYSCVKNLIKLDVKPLDASKVCKEIYEKK